MKALFVLTCLILNAQAWGSHTCRGPVDTEIESIKLIKMTKKEFILEFDGNEEGIVEEGDIVKFYYHNGCDNHVTFYAHKVLFESDVLPLHFSLKVDYYGPEALITDYTLICSQDEESTGSR